MKIFFVMLTRSLIFYLKSYILYDINMLLYIYIYLYLYTFIYIYIYMYIYIYIYMCIYIHIFICVCIYIYVYIFIYIYYIYNIWYIYIYIHSYLMVYVWILKDARCKIKNMECINFTRWSAQACMIVKTQRVPFWIFTQIKNISFDFILILS